MSGGAGLRWTLRAVWPAVVLAAFGCARLDPAAELAAAADSFAAHRYDEAAIRLSSVLQVQPDNVEARRLRGELLLLLGDYRAAAGDLDRARELGAPVDSIALDLADVWTALGQTDQALEMLESAAAALGGNPTYWTLRAEALLRAGRLDDAEAALAAGDRAGDGGVRAQLAHARVAVARNDAPAAEALLGRALEAAPDEPRLLVARAELFARVQRLPEAAADLLRAADLYRTTSLRIREARTLSALVQVQLARNDLDAAEAAATRLASEAPAAALTAYLQGLVAYRRGNFAEAAALIQPLVNAAPETVQFRALLGAIHLARGNYGQAEQQFLSVLAESPRDPAAIKLLAETRLRQQRPEAALATLRAVEHTAEQDPQIGLLSGLANLMSGNTEQGLVYLEQAASLDPSNQMLKLQLARAYLVAGRNAEASGLLKDAFASGSGDLEAGLLRLFADIRLGSRNDGEAEDLLAKFPREPRALTAVAIYFQINGDNKRARELFERAASLETDGATARLFVAAALTQEGRRQEAEQLLAKLVEQQPENTQASTALAELLTARGAYEDAAKLLERAVERSASLSSRLALTQLRIRQGDLAAAKAQLDAAARDAPDNPEVGAVQGLLALAEGRAKDAVTLLQRAASQLPNRLGVVLALARAQLSAEQADAARTTVRRALDVVPRSLPLRLMLGETELKLGNATEALSIATSVKAEYPQQSGGYVLEADAQMAARRYSSAADSLTRAFALEPTWPVMTRLVQTLRLADRSADALRASEEWVKANPQHVPGQVMRAGLLQAAGRDEDALRGYETVLDQDSDNLVALNNAAWLSSKLGRPGALTLAERAYGLATDNAAVLDTLGTILLTESRAQEAATHLARATKLAPRVPEIRYHLAKALAALGRSEEARSMLTTLLEGDVEFDGMADARRLRDSL